MQGKELKIKEFALENEIFLYVLPPEKTRPIYLGASIFEAFFYVQDANKKIIITIIGPKSQTTKIKKLITPELLKQTGLPMGEYSIYEKKQSRELIKTVTI